MKRGSKKATHTCASNQRLSVISCKRSQITIFIIVALILVVGVALFFLVKTGVVPSILGKKEINVNTFMQSCLEEKVKETLSLIMLQGGYIENPLNKTFKFNEDKKPTDISYLCYNQNYYAPCINQEPMFIQHLKQEIKEELSEEFESCFEDLDKNLKKAGYETSVEYDDFNVALTSEKVTLTTKSKIVATKSGETSKYEVFNVKILSRFYDLAIVVQEIISQEARFCNFEYLGFMLLYPNYDIDKFRTGDSTIIYKLKHKKSEEEFRFAIRGCVIPPAF